MNKDTNIGTSKSRSWCLVWKIWPVDIYFWTT